jgi:hypothetical protein
MNLLYLGQVIVAQQTASTGFKVGIPTAVYTRLVSAFRAAAGASNMITMFDTEQSGYNWVTIYLPSAQPQMVRFATGEEMDLAQLPYTYPGHNFVGNISVSVICRSEHSTNPRLNPVYSPIFVFNTIDCLKWTDIMQPEE